MCSVRKGRSECGRWSYSSVWIVDHGVVGVGGEEEAVGGGESEEVVDVFVDGGFDGNETGGEVGVLALPVGKGGFPVRSLFDWDFCLEGFA